MKPKNEFETVLQYAKENQINIKVATKIEDASKQGIHLLNPTEEEIADAVRQAERDLFHTIFIHTVLTFGKVEK